MEKHYIHVASRIEFPAAIPSERNETYRNNLFLAPGLSRNARGSENMAENDVDQGRTTGANFPATTPCLVPETQAMIFDLEKFFIERNQMRRRDFVGRGELTPGVLQNFFLLVRHSLGSGLR
jgi:hypothetical protein